ncbi:hypothetical protein ACFV4Q_10900 [Streptomyces nojiriensis]|uniref:hypothetical protein n=1 Tax=Streptomyces nojiriensis TaxID=66374 RepID=UPI0036659BCF
MKEARRLTNCWTSGDRTVDSVDLPRHEYGVLRRLAGLEFVPRPVDLFREWEHTFLVEERVDGIAFHDFRAQDDVILAPYIRREGRVERFLHPDRASRDGLLPRDDWYAAAMLHYSSVAPATLPTTRCSRRTRSARPTAPAGRP